MTTIYDGDFMEFTDFDTRVPLSCYMPAHKYKYCTRTRSSLTSRERERPERVTGAEKKGTDGS